MTEVIELKILYLVLFVMLLVTTLTILLVMVITAEDMTQEEIDELLNRRDN